MPLESEKSLKKLVDFPTPYGVTVPVYRHPETTDEYLFDVDGCMTMAGIHDDRDRRRCRQAMEAEPNKSSMRLSILTDHGGHTVPKALLPRPKDPAYPSLPKDSHTNIPIENWITAAMDQSDWFSRAGVLIDIVGSNVERQREWGVPDELKALALMLLLTATLEHLMEDEIDCLEAAALYALSHHDEWSSVGVEWLRPFRRTWFRDWALARPQWQEIARMCRTVNRDLPAWIVKGTSV